MHRIRGRRSVVGRLSGVGVQRFDIDNQQNNSTYPIIFLPNLKEQIFTNDLQNKVMFCLINYSMEFELTVPEYSNVQTVSIAEIIDFNNQIKTQTVKKLGFKFGSNKKHDFE